jgi:cobalt-zinc-cadmium efflux system protein
MPANGNSKGLLQALILTSIYFVIEVVGGFFTNSLALLSDASHMFADIAALSLSLFALRISRRPATPKRTFGYYRLEILAALINGLTLWLIVGMIFREAYLRLLSPPEVKTEGMLIVAVLGLGVNVTSALILKSHLASDLNVKGAFLHVVGDALGSVGAIVAGVIMILTDWFVADPLISLFIAVLILYGSWRLLNESVNILMESVPSGMELERIRAAMQSVEGVIKVHDLHVWTVTSGVHTLSAHTVIRPEDDPHKILDQIEDKLKSQFGIEHTTVQLETEDREEKEFVHF